MKLRKPLNPIPQCIDCLLSLSKNAALLAAGDKTVPAEKEGRAAPKILADA